MNKIAKGLFLLWTTLALFGCGGGGGGGAAGEGSKDQITNTPTTAVVRLASEGTLSAGISFAGIGVTINLPAGVTVKTDTAGKVISGTVVGSGVTAGKATVADPDYTPATDATPAKLSFVLASTEVQGFGTGEFATVTCDVASGATPKATDFTMSNLAPVDLRGVPVTGLSVTHTVEFK